MTATPPEDLGLDSEERVPLAALVDEDFLLWLRRLGPASRRGAESFAYSPGLAAAIRRAIVGLERPTRAHIRAAPQDAVMPCMRRAGQEVETQPDGAGLYRILTPVLDIVGKRDPGMPALLVDRNRWGWKARVREGPDRNGDLLFIPFLDKEDR